MPRPTVELPKAFQFRTEIPVRITDINYGKHLGNDAMLSIIHEARVRMLGEYGYTEFNIDGRSIIMVDAVILYKSEAFYGDILQIDISVQDLTRIGFDFVCRVTGKLAGNEIARAKTGMVFFDYERRKPIEVPEKFRWIFSEPARFTPVNRSSASS